MARVGRSVTRLTCRRGTYRVISRFLLDSPWPSLPDVPSLKPALAGFLFCPSKARWHFGGDATPRTTYTPRRHNERSIPLETLKGIVGALGYAILLTALMAAAMYGIYLFVSMLSVS
jgi:hypothetical protein